MSMTTVEVESALLREAREASGASTDENTVQLALEALIRQAAYATLRRSVGSEPLAKNVPRSRSEQI